VLRIVFLSLDNDKNADPQPIAKAGVPWYL